MTPYVKHLEIKSSILSLNLYPLRKTHIIHNSYSLNVCHQYIEIFRKESLTLKCHIAIYRAKRKSLLLREFSFRFFFFKQYNTNDVCFI